MADIADILRAVAPRANPAFVASSRNLGTIAAAYGFDNTASQAMLVAQVAHECGLRTFEENLRYSAQRLTQVWPKRFPTIADAEQCANNPKRLAKQVYGGRMGNRPGTDDGWDYRGSGALQHTGRSEFERVQKRTGLGVVSVPDSLRDPTNADVMWKAAASYFVDRGALEAARAGNVETVTLRVNGGRIGLADRKVLYSRAVAVLAGGPLPKGRTTEEQSDDARRKAKQAGTVAAPAGGASGGAAKQGGGADASVAIGIGLVVVVAVAVIAVLFWRQHKQKQAAVETMQLQLIEARLALANG